MTKKKSIWAFALAFMLIVPAMLLFTACGGGHNHTYSDEWSTSETAHWHACTDKDCKETKDLADHEFVWTTKTEAGVHVDKVETGTCSTCGYQKERTVAGTGTHTYADTYSKDATGHWFESTCEHETPLKKDFAEHIFDDDNDTTCDTCGYVREAQENAITLNVQARTYNGEAQSLLASEYTITGGTPSVMYKLATEEDTAYTETAPTNAGEYVVRVKFEGNALYEAVEKTADLVIAQKELTNIAVSKVYDGTLTAGAKLTADNGVVGEDVVNITVTTNADYINSSQQYANAGTKTVVDAVIDNQNYKLPANDQIGFEITKRQINLVPSNKSTFEEGFWQYTSIPKLEFNNSYIGDVSKYGTSTEIIEKPTIVGADLQWTAISRDEAIKTVGTYKITKTYTGGDNYIGGSYSTLFEVKQVTEISWSDTVSLEAGETKSYMVAFENADKFYKVGKQLTGVTVEVYSGKTYPLTYSVLDGTDSSMYIQADSSNKKLVILTAGEYAVDSKVIFEDATYSGTVDLQENSNTLPTLTGTTDKWVKFVVPNDKISSSRYNVTALLTNAKIFYADYSNSGVAKVLTDETMIDVNQGWDITLFLYCTGDLSGTITVTAQ